MNIFESTTIRFISDGTWFDEGTESYLMDFYFEGHGLFEGIHNGRTEQEACGFDEFTILGIYSE